MLCCAVVWCAVLCCGVVWCGVVWCDVLCCAVLCCGVVCCGVVCCAVVWCGVVCCGVVCCTIAVKNRNRRFSHPSFLPFPFFYTLTHPLTYTQVGDHADNVSDDSSVDAYSVSEVSLDDAPSSRMTLAVTRVIAPPSTSNAGVLPYMTISAPPRALVPMDPPAPVVQNPESDVGPKGGGGLLDATRSSAVSSMLQSAKQKQSNISDECEDDWDE